ncbi:MULTISPECIES: hypothetical protein [unclassified Anabaena]|uniref:hypothetical protein n=1 Tax=unclassified Anabaena TaxID=2619674 RepID=UPI0039C71A12
MVTTVVVINTFISLVLLFVAWQMWKLKGRIGRIADKLSDYERAVHAALYTAPERIDISQQKIHNLRQGNQGLQLQILQVRQIISLLLFGRRFWVRPFGRPGLGRGRKIVTK